VLTSSAAQALVFYGIGALAGAMIGLVSFHLVDLRQIYGFGLFEEGLALSIIALTRAALGLIVAIVISRVAVQPVLIAGLVILGLSNILAIWSGSGTVFLLSRGLASVGFVSLVTALPSAISAIGSIAVRQATMTMWGAYLPIGTALGIVMGMAAGQDWQLSFGLHTTLCAVMAGLLLLLPTKSADTVSETLDLRAFLSSVSVWLFALGFGTFAAVFLVVVGLLPSVLQDATGLDRVDAGLSASFVCLAGVATSVVLSIFTPNPAHFVWLVFSGFLASAAASVLFFMNLDAPVTATFAAVLIIAFSALVPSVVFASFPLLVDDTRHIILLSGLVTQFGNMGSLFGPPAVSQWSAVYGWSTAWLPLSLICLIGALLFILPGRRIARPAGSETLC